MVVGVSIFALACMAGIAVADAGSQKKADAGKSVEKVRVESKRGDKAFLGVTMQELDDNLREGLDVSVKSGVLITDVVEGSPAHRAGIEDGDIIIEFDRRKVDSPDMLRKMVEGAAVGDEVKVKVVREKEPKTLTVTLGEYPENQEWSIITPDHMNWFDGGRRALIDISGRGRLGVRVNDINGDLGAYFGVKEGEGVLVLEVTEGSLGEKLGLKAGDVITGVGEEKIASVEELRDAVSDLEKGDEFTLDVVRSKKSVELAGTMDEDALKMYSGMAPRRFDVKIPKFEWRGLPEPEMKQLQEEMQELKKELKGLKEELEKVKEST